MIRSGMSNSIEDDITALQAMIDGPDMGLSAYLAERPYLGSFKNVRDDLASIIVGLEDVRAGRVVPHAQIVRDMEERRRGHRTIAAE